MALYMYMYIHVIANSALYNVWVCVKVIMTDRDRQVGVAKCDVTRGCGL